MGTALHRRSLPLVLAALVITAASLSGSAIFQAKQPGESLRPLGTADQVIQLLQGSHSIVWSSLGSTVSSVVVEGWPDSYGRTELGGAVMIEKTLGATSGSVDFGERPRSLRFDLAG